MRFRLLCGVWLLLNAVLSVAQTNAPAASLQRRIGQLLDDPLLNTSEVGIAVYDLTVQQPVFSYQDKKLYRPASIEKLITGITALEKLGPDYAFTTRVCYTGELRDSVLYGDLYVVGGFDPEFGEREMDYLISRVKALPLRRIEGQLKGDVSLTDSLRYGEGWSWDDAVYDFQPCLSPLMFCKGVVSVTGTPVAGDTIGRLSASPQSSYYTLRNETKCRRPGAGAFRVGRNWMEQGNILTATGNLTHRTTKRLSLHDSQRFFMHTFAERLCHEGIRTDSVYRFAALPADTDSITDVAQVSHSLREVLTQAMKQSDNLSAEAMLRHVALADGKRRHLSASDGVKVIESQTKLLGFDPERYRIVDGSGVSLYNYISPELLLGFLRFAYSRPELYAVLCETLPIAGVDGTLAHRMKRGSAFRRVRAKTGTVTGVSSLAGFARTPSNHILAFVIINQNVLKPRVAHAFQDRICAELCR